jgi:hypothetical protein
VEIAVVAIVAFVVGVVGTLWALSLIAKPPGHDPLYREDRP